MNWSSLTTTERGAAAAFTKDVDHVARVVEPIGPHHCAGNGPDEDQPKVEKLA
ncbi:hypothetical protein ACIBQX_19750 [Nonomuraea sp. NPDC049714]|uniref:hypothetical protein n=1 Tax=Nonomuraea sp. NPDC049714 TaxID=3364357 RepID=UPI0037AE41BD